MYFHHSLYLVLIYHLIELGRAEDNKGFQTLKCQREVRTVVPPTCLESVFCVVSWRPSQSAEPPKTNIYRE